MKRRSTRVILALGAAALAAVAIAPHLLAQPGPRGMRGMRGGPDMQGFDTVRLLVRELDLTEAQRDQVRMIFDQHEAELRTAGEELRTARRAQNEAIVAMPLDESQVLARADEVGRAQAAVALAVARLHQEVYQSLTAEQQARAVELRAEREAEMAARRERFERRIEERRQRREQAEPTAVP